MTILTTDYVVYLIRLAVVGQCYRLAVGVTGRQRMLTHYRCLIWLMVCPGVRDFSLSDLYLNELLFIIFLLYAASVVFIFV
jgi:hypothetical protein